MVQRAQTLDTAFDVLGDVILSTAAQQYGGFTVSEVDTLMEPYAEKSLRKYRAEYLDIVKEVENGYVYDTEPPVQTDDINSLAEQYALRKVKRDFEQGFQGIEYKLNTVGSSRGGLPVHNLYLWARDYPACQNVFHYYDGGP